MYQIPTIAEFKEIWRTKPMNVIKNLYTTLRFFFSALKSIIGCMDMSPFVIVMPLGDCE